MQYDKDEAAAIAIKNRKHRKMFTPDATFTEEKLRGLVASMTSGALASGLNFGGIAVGINPAVSSLTAIYVIGNLLTYCFDILFAKRVFYVEKGFAGSKGPYEGPVPYTAVGVRLMWLLRSMAGPQFFRFVVSVVIDTLVGLAILKTSLELLDEHEILMEYRTYRDFAVVSVISLATFFLFVNVLRFDWAYTDGSNGNDHIMNIVVLAWLALAMMMFALIMRPRPRVVAPPAATSTPTT
jgi:hypothetical protein